MNVWKTQNLKGKVLLYDFKIKTKYEWFQKTRLQMFWKRCKTPFKEAGSLFFQHISILTEGNLSFSVQENLF